MKQQAHFTSVTLHEKKSIETASAVPSSSHRVLSPQFETYNLFEWSLALLPWSCCFGKNVASADPGFQDALLIFFSRVDSRVTFSLRLSVDIARPLTKVHHHTTIKGLVYGKLHRNPVCLMATKTGWWLGHPSEKCSSIGMVTFPIFLGKCQKFMATSPHQPEKVSCRCSLKPIQSNQQRIPSTAFQSGW